VHRYLFRQKKIILFLATSPFLILAQLSQADQLTPRQVPLLEPFYQQYAMVFWLIFATLGLLLTTIALLIRSISRREHSDTALKESEARYRAVFESIADGIIVTTTSHQIIAMNKGIRDTFGYAEEDIIGKQTSQLYSSTKEYQKLELNACHLSSNNQAGSTPYKATYQKKNGSTFVGETLNAAIKSKNGDALNFISVIRDISSRNQLEEEVRRSQRMDAVGQMAGGIAHDFNNILGIILGNVNLLKYQLPSDPKILSRIDTINKSAMRAANLTSQLLNFSRKKEDQTALISINHTIEGMQKLIMGSVTPQVILDIQLANQVPKPSDIDTAIESLVEVNQSDFENALLNLVINARDAMPDGGALTIKTENCTLDELFCSENHGVSPGEYILLTVSDTGTGISPEHLKSIYEPFFTTKPLGKGTGLGLAMVFGFVERANGHIEVHSKKGAGTTFKIRLPRAEVQETNNLIEHPLMTSSYRGNETILVVDDEKELLKLTRENLQSLGYQVLIASNGAQALEQLSENTSISLMFTDILMPGGINGYDLAKRAIANQTKVKRDLKVLFTSGFAGTSEKPATEYSFDTQVLCKPYTQAELAKKIRERLDEESVKITSAT